MDMNIKIRDKRNRGWFWLDNEYLNGYARYFGPSGTAIYLSLCRHANANQECFPAQELIAKENGITGRTVRKYIKIFSDCKMIVIERERMGGKWKNNVYTLADKNEWVKPEEIVSCGAHQRKITTSPEENNDTNQRKPFPTKNTNKKNTNNKKELLKLKNHLREKLNFPI